MSAITKATKNGVHRVHAVNAKGRPVCGGGFQSRQANWQTDLAEPNCEACAAILERRAIKTNQQPRKEK
jgi:hypothetical protein